MPARVFVADLCGAQPLAAAARFHAEILPDLESLLAGGASVVVRFDHAEDKPHRWRREAIAALARQYAPLRVNAVAPAQSVTEERNMQAAIAFLCENAGVTGQLLIAG